MGRLQHWVAGGISATHHTAGRIDADHNQVRRAICWNDHSLAEYHAKGLARLGGQDGVRKLIGGPWAIRYSLSHLVKDEATLYRGRLAAHRTPILPHGSLAAGYLTGNFDVASVSAAASTGIMDLRTESMVPGYARRPGSAGVSRAGLEAVAAHHRSFRADRPVVRPRLALEAGSICSARPWIFPTSDDQQAGLVGGGAVDAGQMAIILGNSAVVNSSVSEPPGSGDLDAMRLNWGPYLWMRCYNNGAQFLDRIVGNHPDWDDLEKAGRACPPGANGFQVLPFIAPEPSLGVARPRFAVVAP